VLIRGGKGLRLASHRLTGSRLLCLRPFPGGNDAFFQDIERDVGLLLRDHQRWRDTNRALAGAEEQNSAREGQFDYAITKLANWRLRLFVLDQFQTDHQPASADVAYHGVFAGPGAKPLHDMAASFVGVAHCFTLQNVERGQRRRDADRVAAEG
jgi:hypothetical protein